MKRGAIEVWADHATARTKRMRMSDGGGEDSRIIDYSDPFAVPNLLESLSSGKYGSVTNDVKALIQRKTQMLNSFLTLFPDLERTSMGTPCNMSGRESGLVGNEVVDLDYIQAESIVSVNGPVVIIDSDEEDNVERIPVHPFEEISFPKPTFELPTDHLPVDNGIGTNTVKVEDEKVHKDKDKGVYLGVEDELSDEGHGSTIEDDGLSDLWKEMNFALESSKDVQFDKSSDELSEEDDEGCDHSFVLKDDIGYVCRVCGVVQRAIETIFDFQYIKAARIRTYRSESRYNKENENGVLDGIKLVGHDLAVTEISAHPKHKKLMKPHQLEGFNFLLSNLITENPGGCILAHAPGSGKTFMILSFMQSFMAQYPDARPLVVLPKGILPTWKREFQLRQVEDIPLLDFYSVKAENRHQQRDVLKKWVEQRSILFLGYKQFSTIVVGDSTCRITADCQDILLKKPDLLILDEGHTSRNELTDLYQALAKVQTPRKVVLSGTLYQNHVKEVFNILNLVRPKFLKQETSRSIQKRIQSRLKFDDFGKQVKGSASLDNNFYDLVEHTLKQEADSKRKEAVIKDLREMTSRVLHYYRGDFLDDLPGLLDFTVLLELSPQQKLEVQKLKKKFKAKFKQSSLGCAVYTHPKLKQFTDNNSGDEKSLMLTDGRVDELLGKIDIKEGVKTKFFLNMLGLCESRGEKLLVFGQYLLPLKFLERLCVYRKNYRMGKEMFMITGDTSTEQREMAMEQFNNSPDARVFFGSIKACGEGISLVGASRIIILDIHLNPSVTRQAIGRAFRPGQVKKVYAYRLVAADSPEEEDHLTCLKKEQIAKRWFEWNEYCGNHDFAMQEVEVKDCDDEFLETPLLAEDIKALQRR